MLVNLVPLPKDFCHSDHINLAKVAEHIVATLSRGNTVLLRPSTLESDHCKNCVTVICTMLGMLCVACGTPHSTGNMQELGMMERNNVVLEQ